MRNYLIMDGVDSRTFGLYINGANTFGAPAREVSTLQIPGRNGDLSLIRLAACLAVDRSCKELYIIG